MPAILFQAIYKSIRNTKEYRTEEAKAGGFDQVFFPPLYTLKQLAEPHYFSAAPPAPKRKKDAAPTLLAFGFK
jgi:hypothetical protein